VLTRSIVGGEHFPREGDAIEILIEQRDPRRRVVVDCDSARIEVDWRRCGTDVDIGVVRRAVDGKRLNRRQSRRLEEALASAGRGSRAKRYTFDRDHSLIEDRVFGDVVAIIIRRAV